MENQKDLPTLHGKTFVPKIRRVISKNLACNRQCKDYNKRDQKKFASDSSARNNAGEVQSKSVVVNIHF